MPPAILGVEGSHMHRFKSWVAVVALPLVAACADTPMADLSALPPEKLPPAEHGNRFLPEGVVTADVPPPAIQGGTLLVTAADLAIVADPDRDAVYLVDLETNTVEATLPLEPGDQPGRAVADAGRAHVVLRNGGALATIDLASGDLLAREEVCATPRGIALDETGALHVACETGELWSRAPTGTWSAVELDRDLRDVVAFEGRLYVSRFRSAEVLVLEDGAIVRRERPTITPEEILPPPPGLGEPEPDPVPEAHVAWRLQGTPGRGVQLLHQLHVDAEVVVSSGYGGASCSGGLVGAALTRIDEPGEPLRLPGLLVTDFAVAPNRAHIVTAATGNAFDPHEELPDVFVTGLSPQLHSACAEHVLAHSWPDTFEIVAVGWASDGTVVAQSREPAALLRRGPDAKTTVIPLSDVSRRDTGLAIFHANTGGNIACASCHPGGRDDGHVWTFDDSGRRRTQSLAGTLTGTAPYHWDGALPDLSVLMREVFSDRMRGAELDDAHRDAFTSWLLSLPAPPAHEMGDAAERGRALFESSDIGCASCHAGPTFTDNRTVDVGTGLELQVPSLVGVGARAPYMHDGCASTLMDRFNPICGGGDQHGTVSHLSLENIADLVAYMETL